MPLLEQSVLTGRVVRLEPLSRTHIPGLRVAAGVDRSTYGFTSVPLPEDVESYVAQRLGEQAAGAGAPFAQIEVATGRVVGHTGLWWPFYLDGRLSAVEAGRTWLAPDVQGSAINSESKLLLFTHAFEVWKVDRVQICTDARNERSRAAIAAVGGVFEGVLRNYGRSHVAGEDGRPRNTAMFSVIAEDWPATKQRLEQRVVSKL